MPFAEIRFTQPKRMNIRRIEQAILAELAAEGEDDAALFEATTKTWKHEKPSFRPKVGRRGNDALVRTAPGGSAKGMAKYRWLDQGTRVRWAIMSGGWRSKTRSGYLTSYKGAGRVVAVGKRRKVKSKKTGKVRYVPMKPRPGIKAREFTSTIQKRQTPKFKKRMIAAHGRAVGSLYA